MDGSYSATWPLPARLAAYIAMSARENNSSSVGVGWSAGTSAMPMLAPIDSCSPPSVNGGRSALDQPGADVDGIAVALDQDGEFVAAEPGDGVAGPDRAAQPLGHPDHQLVTDRMAEGVVDRLEVVEVDEQQGQRPQAAPVLLQGVGDPIGEQRPVRQPGQLVGERLPLQFQLPVLQMPGQRHVVPDRQVLPDQHTDEGEDDERRR